MHSSKKPMNFSKFFTNFFTTFSVPKTFLFFCIFILTITLSQFALADTPEQYHLTLLAVQDQGDGSYVGSTADLYVEIKEGSGRVFLDTTPLTKLDTQVSTRYAKQVACEYYNLPCENYDFFYTIISETGIIGGPSAGAAMSALTALAVMDLDYDDSLALTGTINSGGTVGPVGGVKEKIEAANNLGLKTVLVPLTALDEVLNKEQISKAITLTNESEYDQNNSDSQIINNEIIDIENPFEIEVFDWLEEDNLTLENYAKYQLEINAYEVSELDDVLFHLTGQRHLNEESTFEVDSQYDSIMARLQRDLCLRARSLETEILNKDNEEDTIDWDYYNARFLLSDSAKEQGDYYASASFCFGLNTQLRTELLILEKQDLQKDELLLELQYQETILLDLEEDLDQTELETISDLQTKIVVSERINDAQQRIENMRTQIASEDYETSISTYFNLGYITERVYSAQTWMLFFEMNGIELSLDENSLSLVCTLKLAEADERYNYANVYVPFSLENIFEKIQLGKEAQNEADYELCIAQAIQAKADSTSILSSSGISTDAIEEFLAVKKQAAERIIAANSEEGSFPILGYSYYQYAKNLADEEPYSALLYYEYALEMSELDIYFPASDDKISGFSDNFNFDIDTWSFLLGVFSGFALGALLMWLISLGAKR